MSEQHEKKSFRASMLGNVVTSNPTYPSLGLHVTSSTVYGTQ